MPKSAAEIFPDVGNSMTLTPEQKQARAEQAIAALNHKFGRTAIQVGGLSPVPRMSTGLASADLLLRQKDRATGATIAFGIPRGRFTTFWGPESAGKTGLLYHVIAQVQRSGGIAALQDAEHRFDPIWAAQLGVDCDMLLLSRPNTLEEACYTTEKLAEAGIDLVGIDSIIAVASSAELHDGKGKEFDIDHTTMGVIPKRLSEFFRRATPVVGKSPTAVILINQVRMNLGGYIVVPDFPGGHALRHYLTVNIRITRSKTDRKPIDDRGLTPNHTVTLKVIKGMNEGQEKETTFFAEYGFHPLDDLVEQLIVSNLLPTKGNGRYQFDGKSYFRNDLLEIVEPEFDEWYAKLLGTTPSASPSHAAK